MQKQPAKEDQPKESVPHPNELRFDKSVTNSNVHDIFIKSIPTVDDSELRFRRALRHHAFKFCLGDTLHGRRLCCSQGLKAPPSPSCDRHKWPCTLKSSNLWMEPHDMGRKLSPELIRDAPNSHTFQKNRETKRVNEKCDNRTSTSQGRAGPNRSFP
ncbi:hypothetical protein BpHYR1_012376 [Brachionus plicatilis]|uniref:Uncharacterized protein n=1 Tax=Brachionus plicatilis TaxID=10195 RepID=A0A3M7RU26_BRAPC|nr:hypothetical protein BpHYR1_012376 [Brachionus plicatilis]